MNFSFDKKNFNNTISFKRIKVKKKMYIKHYQEQNYFDNTFCLKVFSFD